MRKDICRDGYNLIYLPSHHRAHQNGYVLEHIVVAEIKLGRLITKNEIVHHKDRNKKNNSPDNLEVMTRSEHNQLHAAEDKGKRKKRGSNLLPKRRDKLPAGYYFLKGVGIRRKEEKKRVN